MIKTQTTTTSAQLESTPPFYAQNRAFGEWNFDFECLGGSLRFFECPGTKMCPSEMALKCNFRVFRYIHLVKFLKNLQNFLKRRLWLPFGRFAPENSKTLQSKSPPLGRNPAINPPLRGVEPPLYLVLGRSKGLIRGLMHPYSRPKGLSVYEALLTARLWIGPSKAQDPIQNHRFIFLGYFGKMIQIMMK